MLIVKMFVVSRFEQRIEYFWTGNNWSIKRADAKEFSSEAEAQAAPTGVSTVNITPLNTNQPNSKPGPQPGRKGIMSEASDLIERMEKETGQRIDDNDGDNNAMAGLLGAMSRLMGQSPPTYRECDDVIAGQLIKYQMSEEERKEQQSKKLMAAMLTEGMSPDDIKALMG